MPHCHLLDGKEIAQATSQALSRFHVGSGEIPSSPSNVPLLELGAVGIPGLSRTTAEKAALLLPLIRPEGMELCTDHLFPFQLQMWVLSVTHNGLRIDSS